MMNDSQIYCISAANSINKLRAIDPKFQEKLDILINQTLNNEFIQKVSYDELLPLTVQYTRENVVNSGGDIHDVNTVAWELGLLCYIFRNSCPATNNQFDRLFIDSWNMYFDELNNENLISSSTFKISLDNFLFTSSYHTRYRNGIKVAGPTVAGRGVKFIRHPVDKENAYFVSIINTDGVGPQFTLPPKPMKIISSNTKSILLRGFGKSETDTYSDYGIEIFFNGGNVDQIDCILYDRNIIIEYYK